jgi:hypothetical protein
MRSVKVKIVGTSPLMMNRRPLDENEGEKVKKKGVTMDPVEDAERKSWNDPKIGYYIPSDMIEGCLREAGKNFKSGRGSLKNTILASVFCADEKVSLGRKDYDEVDKRWGTHPSTGNSVLTSRVKFNKWEATFTINYDESKIDDKTMKGLLEEAGTCKGIGSYRPKFGRFKVAKYEVAREVCIK